MKLDEENTVLFDGALLVDVQLQFTPGPNSLHIVELLEKGEGADASFPCP